MWCRRTTGKLMMVASGVFALVSVASREAAAYEIKHTTGGTVVRWWESDVALVVDPSVSDGVAGGGGALDGALHAWSGVEGSPALSMTVGPGGGHVAVDGQNTILYAHDGFAPAGNALAVTVFSYDNVSGRIVDTDVVINGQHAFAVLPDGQRPANGAEPVSTEGGSGGDGRDGHGNGERSGQAPFDIQHVVAHELGHVLGLGDDLETQDALMYIYTAPGDASLRAPTTDDLDGVTAVYGASTGPGPSAHAGCGKASVVGSRVTGVDAWCAVALLVGAGAWLSRRRGLRVAVPVCASCVVLFAGSQDARSATGRGLAAGADARAVVVSAEASEVDGVLRTTLVLAPTECRTAACPDRVVANVWGGTSGGITQVVGDREVPRVGDAMDVTLAALP